MLSDLPACAAYPYYGVAGVHFLHISVQLSEACLARGEEFLGTGHDKHRQHHSDKRHAERNQRKPPFGDKHHDKTADKLRGGTYYRRKAVCQSLLKGRDVVCYTAQNIALRGSVYICLRDPVYLFRKLSAHTVGHFQGHDSHNIVLYKAEESACNIYRGKEGSDPCDCGNVDSGKKSVGHYRGDLSDLIGTDYRENCAECREDKCCDYKTELRAHIFRQSRYRFSDASGFFCRPVFHHIHLLSLLYRSSDADSWDSAISR